MANEILYDTHAHLTYSQFAGRLPEIRQQAENHGVRTINCVATDLDSTRAAIAIAQQYDGIFATAGWHPNDCAGATEELWRQVRALAAVDQVVALGETGLDLYWKDCPLATQQEWFQRHWDLSRELGKPVVIHMRDCQQEMIESLQSEFRQGVLNGVMHSFTGSRETAAACLDMGLYISFAGMLTYKNADSLRGVAKYVPLDRLLIETDSPFLAPVPHRGEKPNQPAWVRFVAECLAEVRGTSVAEIARATTANACRLFGVGAHL